MPEYEYEALDSSGKSVTGSVFCSDEQQALEQVQEFGFHITKLTPRKETPQEPLSKYWDGTFWDAVGWIFWGVCIPLAGLIWGLNNPEKVPPAVGIIFAGLFSLFFISKRVLDGKWPEDGPGCGGGCGSSCGGGGCGGGD
jgi:hypothetical protein